MAGATDSERRRADADTETAMEIVTLLADEVGPRRPTSRAERLAFSLLRERLGREGVDAEAEEFHGYSSFAYPFGAIEIASLLPGLLPARMRRLRSALALAAGAALLSEGSLRRPLLSRLLSRGRSRNLVGTIEPAGEVKRTLCLMAHVDSSRSGLIFDPRFVGALGAWISAQSISCLAQAALEPLLGGRRAGRRALAVPRLVLAAGVLTLLERELRGVDVPGANDNASGAAVVSVLAARYAREPLAGTRIVVALTGCEESGTLGAQALLESRDTSGWLFLNVDNVGGPGSVRYLTREGVLAKFDADPGMIAAAEAAAAAAPELRLRPTANPAGLTYDSSPVLAQGGRALTLSVQDGSIPNLHMPTDTVENVDPDGVSRTIRAAAGIVAEIDAGTADLR